MLQTVLGLKTHCLLYWFGPQGGKADIEVLKILTQRKAYMIFIGMSQVSTVCWMNPFLTTNICVKNSTSTLNPLVSWTPGRFIFKLPWTFLYLLVKWCFQHSPNLLLWKPEQIILVGCFPSVSHWPKSIGPNLQDEVK